MKNLKSHSGETLIEIMIAVSVLMIALAPSSALYIDSIKSTAANRDYLVAETLAEEGIELVRNIRDTNALRFSAKAKECWNAKLEANMDNCNTAKIEPDFYRISMDLSSTNFPANLEIQNFSFNPSDPADEYRLKLNSSTGLYNYEPEKTGENSYSNFYREINIQYSVAALDDVMFVSSRVFFKSGAKLKEVFRTAVLTSTAK